MEENKLDELLKNAESGNSEAQKKALKCIDELTEMYKKESKSIEDLYEKLFDVKSKKILSKLGKDYEYGYNVKKDLKKAFSCYQKSAEIGYSEREYFMVVYFCVQYADVIENSFQIAKEYANKIMEEKKFETLDELFEMYD